MVFIFTFSKVSLAEVTLMLLFDRQVERGWTTTLLENQTARVSNARPTMHSLLSTSLFSVHVGCETYRESGSVLSAIADIQLLFVHHAELLNRSSATHSRLTHPSL